jgi:hypothetical protein
MPRVFALVTEVDILKGLDVDVRRICWMSRYSECQSGNRSKRMSALEDMKQWDMTVLW